MSERGTELREALMLPGLLCDKRLWAEQSKGLVGSALLRTPDLTTYESIAAMAEGVLDQAPERFARPGSRWAVRSPGGRRPSAGACVSAGTPAHESLGVLPAVREHYLDSIVGIEASGLDTYLVDAFPLYVAPERAPPSAVEHLRSMAKSLGPTVAVRQMRSLLEYPGFRCDLGRIACPTAIICGREDRRTPVAVHEELAERIPKARLRVIERAGHFTPLEAPQAVTDALHEWLHASM